jgi:hypothetical protein
MKACVIAPGTESVAETLDAIRTLAMTAEAAEAEIDAMEEGDLPGWPDALDDTLDRHARAMEALVAEVRAAEPALAALVAGLAPGLRS